MVVVIVTADGEATADLAVHAETGAAPDTTTATAQDHPSSATSATKTTGKNLGGGAEASATSTGTTDHGAMHQKVLVAAHPHPLVTAAQTCHPVAAAPSSLLRPLEPLPRQSRQTRCPTLR